MGVRLGVRLNGRFVITYGGMLGGMLDVQLGKWHGGPLRATL